MKAGTKTLLFGVHNIFIHPIFVFIAWLVLYRSLPSLPQFLAIITHDWGLWGLPDIDGADGETHPERSARLWTRLSQRWMRNMWLFDIMLVANKEILGHSRFYVGKLNIPLSKLFYADKLSVSFYPISLYLLLGLLSGEIREYRKLTAAEKYSHVNNSNIFSWFIETRSKMALYGLGKMGNSQSEIESNLRKR